MGQRFRQKTKLSKNQFGFMPKEVDYGSCLLTWTINKKYREKKKNLHIIFIALEKANN